MRLGLELGADVPVFVRGRSAWAEGIGEKMTPLEPAEAVYLVIQQGPGVASISSLCPLIAPTSTPSSDYGRSCI